MGTVTSYTAERIQEIEDNSVTNVEITDGVVSITKGDGTETIVGTLLEPGSPIPTVTGSRGGNAALASLLTALANLGIIVNNSTA